MIGGIFGRTLARAIALAAMASCGGSVVFDGAPDGTDGGAAGATACGSITCVAGEYCKSLDDCDTGCVSDANCAPGQRCEKAEDEETGLCAG